MDTAKIDSLGHRLWNARQTGARIPPLTHEHPGLTITDAYAIQLAYVQRCKAAGGRIIGWKVGMTSSGRGVTAEGHLGPISGHLFADMVVLTGSAVATSTLSKPHVEGEIAFVLGKPLKGPGITIVDVLSSTSSVAPALEVIDYRFTGDNGQAEDWIADNCLSALAVLGGRTASILDLDLRLTGMVMTRNGVPIATGAGAAVSGHPAKSVAWLANHLATFGLTLSPGEVVLTGSVAGAHPALAGDVFTAEFDTLGSATIGFTL